MHLALRATTANPDEAAMPFVVEALHCLRVGITMFDTDERLIFANEHYNYLFRSLPPRDKLVGLSFEEIVRLEIDGGDIVPAAAHENADAFVRHCRVQLFAGDYIPRDVRTADGRIIEIKTRRSPSKGWIALWTDVTQARHNLERLRSTIAMAADAFAFYDRNDRLILCNEEYAALVDNAMPQQIVGRSFAELIGYIANNVAGDTKAWLEKRLEVHRQTAGAMTVEFTDGHAYLLRDRASADGGRIVVFTDITDHHRAEMALAEQTRALADTREALALTKAQSEEQASYLADLTSKLDQTAQSADTTKRTLLRTMSHELKTPLNAIIGFSDLLGTLADHAGPEQIREYAGLIHLGGKNLLKLINQILDLTKISGGRYELRRQDISVEMALWEVRQRHEERALAKNIEIAVEPCAEALSVNADETALCAMLTHLIENALTFTQPGGLVCLSAGHNDGLVRLVVSDNGPGVAAGDLKRILEPFEQGGRSTTDHDAGTGLGLTLVKAFAELHGGALTVESVHGEGFTAFLDLPSSN